MILKALSIHPLDEVKKIATLRLWQDE